MKLRKVPDINVVYKSKEIEMLQRKDIIEKVEEFLINGDAINSKESKRFEESFDSTRYAYVAYLYGDGGIGKTYICKMLQEQITTLSQESQVVYKVYYDLAKRGDFPTKIADLSILIKDCFDNQEIFPIFDYAYNVYISKVGERQNNFKEQVSSESGVMDTAISIVSCIPGFSNAADIVTAGKNVFSLIQKYKKNKQTIENFHIIDKLPLEELKVRLDWYFAKDLNNYFEQYPEVRLIVILDTFENFIYRDLKNGKTLNPTEWLFGKTGIIRLLQNTFWVIAGREDIDWKLYDSESHEITFRKIKVEKPDRLIVEQYLVDAGLDSCSAKEITKSTHCYPLHFGMCLDLFFKSWNEHLQECQKSIELLDDCKPGAGEVAEIIQLVKDSSIVSDRVLGYFNKQERDVIFTLACLKQWNDDILSEVIWKHFPSNFTFYESIKGFSFIKKQGDIYEFQTDTLQELVINCPNLIKRNLISSILTALGEEGEFYHLLVQSLVHITLYYQTEMNSWGTVLEYLYEGMYSFLRSNLFGVVDDSCEKFLRMLQDSNQDSGNVSFKFSIWVWKYISSVVQESLNKTEIVVVDYFHLSKNGRSEFTSDDCFREMEQIIRPMTQEDIPKEFVWATNAVYQWLSIYGLYREAYDFMQLILSKFNRPLEEIFYKHNVYRVAVLADAKLCYLSWNKYKGISKDLHTIEAENVEWVLKKLEVLIEYISENNRNLEGELRYLITSYIRLIKPLMTTDKSKIKLSEGIIKNFDKFLNLYRAVIDTNDVRDVVSLKLVECMIAWNDENFEFLFKTAFQGLHQWISEYGVDLEDLTIFERLCHWIAAAILFRKLEVELLDLISAEEVTSYQKLFDRVVPEFCKTLNLKYYEFLNTLDTINDKLFKKKKDMWHKYVFQFNNLSHKDLRKRVILEVLYNFYGYSGLQQCFHSSKKKKPLDDSESEIAYDDPEYFRLLNEIEIAEVLGYASNNNYLCYGILQRLEQLYSEARGIEKFDIAELLVNYVLNVFYNADGVIMQRCTGFLYKIFSYIDRNFIEPLEYEIVMDNEENTSSHASCFDGLRGWIFYLDYEIDKKVNQNVLNILYNVMTSDNFRMTETFYKAVNKGLDRFLCLRLELEAGTNIVKFLDYITKVPEQNDMTKAAIEKWKSALPRYRTKFSSFDKNPSVLSALINYEILDPINNVTLEELLASEDYVGAQKYFKYYTEGGKLINPSFLMGKDYYEPIVFHRGKTAILEGLDKVRKKIKNDPNDSTESFRDIFRREVVLEGYHDYKTEKDFITFVHDSFDDFCRDAVDREIADSDKYFKAVLSLLTATKDRDLVRTYVFTIKSHSEQDKFSKGHRHRFLIENYNLIKDFVDFSEIWDSESLERITVGLEGCMELYGNLKGSIPEEQLNEIILKAAGKHLDILLVGAELFGSLVPIDSIDGPYYQWLQKLWGDKTDKMIGSRYPYIVNARNLYQSKYKVMIE